MNGAIGKQRQWLQQPMNRKWLPWSRCLRSCVDRRGINIEKEKIKVKCPYCGYPVNVFRTKDAVCKGIFLKCKNKDCKKEFELKL